MILNFAHAKTTGTVVFGSYHETNFEFFSCVRIDVTSAGAEDAVTASGIINTKIGRLIAKTAERPTGRSDWPVFSI